MKIRLNLDMENPQKNITYLIKGTGASFSLVSLFVGKSDHGVIVLSFVLLEAKTGTCANRLVRLNCHRGSRGPNANLGSSLLS